MWFSCAFLKMSDEIRLPFREIATASPLAMPRNDIMTSFEAPHKGAFVLGKTYLIK